MVLYPDLVYLYGCTIAAETRIGPFVEVQRGARIGARCKISSHSFICEGATIQDEVFVGHGVMFTNGLLPKATNEDGSPQRDGDWECTPTHLSRGASIGSNATIIRGVTIGRDALVGAGAVVTRDVPIARSSRVVRRMGEFRKRTDAPHENRLRGGAPVRRDLVADTNVDAVLVAMPVCTYFEIARAALRAAKHVLVEKLMTNSPETAEILVKEAARRRLVLMVGHFVYPGAVQTIAGVITSGEVGDIYYYDSIR